MPYIVKLPGGWLGRGKIVTRVDHASVYPHPSSAKRAAFGFDGAELEPLEKKAIGRPRKAGASPINLNLSTAHVAKARRIGGKNASEGVRKALDNYDEGEPK